MNNRVTIASAAVYAVPDVIPLLGSAFYKTYDYMLGVITHAVTSVYNGFMGGDFVDILQSLITGQLTQAFQQAWEDSGETSFLLPDYLQNALDAMITQNINFDYIYGYYTDIVDARVDKTPLQPLLTRAEMWANQYNAAYNEAERLINIQNGGNLVWRKGNTEHGCSTCANLDGIVMSAREWDELDVHPQGYPNPKLECQGGGPGNFCDCSLVPTDQRRSPNGYSTVMNIVSK